MSKLKWLMIPVVAALLYVIWTQGLPMLGISPPGADQDLSSARGVAQAYVSAAVKGEHDAVDKLVDPGILEEARRVAAEIQGLGADPWSVNVKETKTETDDPELEVYTWAMGARMTLIELRPDGEGWKITSVVLH